jgi:hypothetical protein
MSASQGTIESMLAACQQAAVANVTGACRRGNIVAITAAEADDVMVTGDLHGHRENYERILRIADLAGHPRRHLVLQEVCHGGPAYPGGGGCQSHTLLADVIRLKARYPERVHFLLSNHELAELTDYPIVKARRMLNLSFRCGLHEAYGHDAERVREGYLQFVGTSPLAVRLPGDVVVTHSLPEDVDRRGFPVEVFDRSLTPDDFREQGPLFQLVWGRDYRPENAAAFASLVGAKVLIHGHDPCPQGFKVPNALQVILDCCSSPASYLILPTALHLDHRQIVERVRPLS